MHHRRRLAIGIATVLTVVASWCIELASHQRADGRHHEPQCGHGPVDFDAAPSLLAQTVDDEHCAPCHLQLAPAVASLGVDQPTLVRLGQHFVRPTGPVRPIERRSPPRGPPPFA